MQVHWPQPSHPGIIKVISQPGSYTSYAVSLQDFPPGTLLAHLAAPTLTLSPRAYSSVQVGPKPTDNVELNSDFLFINHSCRPNLEFHILNAESLGTAKSAVEHGVVVEIRVAKRVDGEGREMGLREGEALSFFYPSTEWEMAQPFECDCGENGCKGLIGGAKGFGKEELKEYFVNEHIWSLKAEQEMEEQETLNGSTSASASGSGSAGGISPR